jgi:hemerythrin-like domain-containing protein
MNWIHSRPRRSLLAGATACALFTPVIATEKQRPNTAQEKEVGAVEDLMREHGVLRRALLVYAESASRIRRNATQVDAQALHENAKLFRSFGEDYHEKKLEETYLFPAVKKAGGDAAGYVDILIAQHSRGREVTDYVMAATRAGKLRTIDAAPLADVLSSFVVMYQNHAAREDTIVFPAWKMALSQQQLEEFGDKFEDIERQQFGADGYEEAVKRVAEIEQRLGLADLAQFTPGPPPTLVHS